MAMCSQSGNGIMRLTHGAAPCPAATTCPKKRQTRRCSGCYGTSSNSSGGSNPQQGHRIQIFISSLYADGISVKSLYLKAQALVERDCVGVPFPYGQFDASKPKREGRVDRPLHQLPTNAFAANSGNRPTPKVPQCE